MTLSPHTRNTLQTFLEINEMVQIRLARHKQTLIREGMDRSEAWAFCQLLEERVMVRVMDLTESELKVEGLIESVIQEEIQRERETDRA